MLTHVESGPRTCTSSDFIPCSAAFRPASSAAICAANGVDLRDPLKPMPADAQAIVLPCTSVMSHCVEGQLRNTTGDVFALATTNTALAWLFCHFRLLVFRCYFFLPAMAFAGPLRVRALCGYAGRGQAGYDDAAVPADGQGRIALDVH